MKAQLVFASVCLFGLVLFAEEAGAGKDKKTTVSKGKGTVTPSLVKPILLDKTKVVAPSKPVDPAKSKKYREFLKKSSEDWKTSADQKASLGKLFGDQPLNDQDRQQLSDLLFNAQAAGLSKEDETQLSYLLLDETARNNTVATANPPSEDKSGPLYLRIFNNTGERLKVWVQIVPEAAEKKGHEADPKEPVKLETLPYDLATGKAYDLQNMGKKIQATAIKVWAISPSKSWAQHRDEPLYLTTPANNSKTYTLTFDK